MTTTHDYAAAVAQLTRVVRQIKENQQKVEHAVTRGTVTGYDEYQRKVGYIRGTDDAILILNEHIERMTKEDD